MPSRHDAAVQVGRAEGLPAKTERKWRKRCRRSRSGHDAVLADQKSGKSLRCKPSRRSESRRSIPICVCRRAGDHERVIATSARFKGLFAILDGAHPCGRTGLRLRRSSRRTARPRGVDPPSLSDDAAPADHQRRHIHQVLEHIKDDFQRGQGFDVLLLGPRSAGFGLTLTAANQVVHMNRWWNPAVEDQCSDRVYRLGQDKAVTIHVPLAVHPSFGERSFDVVLDAMLSGKRGLSQEIVVPTTMTEGDFRRCWPASPAGIPATGPDTAGHHGMEGVREWTAEQFTGPDTRPTGRPGRGMPART